MEALVIVVVAALGLPALGALAFRAFVGRQEALPEPSKPTAPRRRDGVAAIVDAVADALLVESGDFRVPGRLAGCPVEVDYDQARDAFSVSLMGLVEGIAIAPYRAVLRNLVDGGYVTGDEAFDRTFRIQGGEGRVRAALDAPTRATLVHVAPQITVSDGRLEATIEGPIHRAALRDVMSALEALGDRLSSGGGVVERIAAHVAEDPHAGVRRACLEFLVEHHADEPETADTAYRALDDEDARVRLFAATALGAAGFEVAAAIALDPEVETDLRVAAFRAAVPHAPADRRVELAVALEIEGSDSAAVARFEAAEAYRITALSEDVRARVDDVSSPVALAAVRAARVVGDATWSPRLITALQSDPDDDLVVALCRALEAHAGVEAVAPLDAYATGVLRARRVRDAAQAALQAVRSRSSQDAGAGQLSVVEGDRGQLSVAKEAGALSLDAEDREP